MEQLMGQFTCNPLYGFLLYSQKYFFIVIINNYFLQTVFLVVFFYLYFFFNSFIFSFNFRLFIFFIFYDFFFKMLKNIISLQGIFFFSFFYCIFFFLFFSNIFSLFPYNITITSHIDYTCTLGFSILVGIVISGFLFAGRQFLNVVIPQNISKILLPFLILIETISYLMRPFSLGIRLFANILAGHALVFILLFFTYFLLSLNFFSKIIFFLPFFMTFIIFFLELLVAFLQAYVFVVLIAIYLKDFIDFIPFSFYNSFLYKNYLSFLQATYLFAKKGNKKIFFLSNIYNSSLKFRKIVNNYF